MNGRKILLVTLDFWPQTGGVANYYFNLCRQLGERAVVLTVETLKHLPADAARPAWQAGPPADATRPAWQTSKSTKTLKQELGFKIVRRNLLVNWLWPRWLLMFWHVWETARREKVEVLWAGEILPSGTVVYALSKLLRLPYIVSCHGKDILQASKVRRRKKMARKILNGAKSVTVNSRYTGRLVKKLGIEDGKIKVVYPGIDYKNIPPNKQFERFTDSEGGSPIGRKTLKHKNNNIKEEFIKKYNLRDKKIILSVGRLVKRKGFDKVIEAMPQVAAKVPEAVYLIAGSGPNEKKLKELGSKMPEQIKFLGRVSEEEKWALLELSDVFIMPARENNEDVEGFGIVYLEAGLVGKPVVAGKAGGAKEAVVDKQTGLLVNPESVDEISRALVELLNNQQLAGKLGRAGQQRAREQFGWEKVGGEFREIIDEIE